MRNLLGYIRSTTVIISATVILIGGSKLFSQEVFEASSWLSVLTLAFVLASISSVLYSIIAAIVMRTFELKTPGILLMSLCGIAGGTVAISLIAAIAPGTIAVGGIITPVIYSVANTGLLWLIGWLFGVVRKDLAFFPAR